MYMGLLRISDRLSLSSALSANENSTRRIRLKRHDCTAKPSQASVKHLCALGVVVDEIMNWVVVNQTWLGNLLPDTLELDAIERKLLPDEKN